MPKHRSGSHAKTSNVTDEIIQKYLEHHRELNEDDNNKFFREE